MDQSQRKQKLLTGSITLSFAIHAILAALVQSSPAWFARPPKHPLANQSQPIEHLSKDRVLQEAFVLNDEQRHADASSKPRREDEKLTSLAAPIVIQEPKEQSWQLLPPSVQELLTPLHFSTTQLRVPEPFHVDLFADLPTDWLKSPPNNPPQSKPAAFCIEEPLCPQFIEPRVNLPAASNPDITFSQSAIKTATVTQEQAMAPSQLAVMHLPKLPTLEELDTMNASELFDVDLIFLPKEEDDGFIFALTLIPHPNLQLPRLRQNITFLIDRSNSIQKTRLSATKQAVLKALDELSIEDSFNLIAFDSKFEKLSNRSIAISPQNEKLAVQFLDAIQLGSFFSFADLYSPLLYALPGKIAEDELHTAILITDGESLAKKHVQRSLLNQWTAQNKGKTALYIVSMDDDRYQQTLDLISFFNKGKLISSSNHRGMKRKLIKLVRTLASPLAKDLTVTAVTTNPQAHIELYPKADTAPHLFHDLPYVILGTTRSLDDFFLFVQGKLNNQWMNIKKKISFVNAKKGGNTLRSEWALKCAYEKYQEYAIYENPDLLAEAAAILEPHDIKAALP